MFLALILYSWNKSLDSFECFKSWYLTMKISGVSDYYYLSVVKIEMTEAHENFTSLDILGAIKFLFL